MGVLILSNNQLRYLPDSIVDLKNLKELSIKRNPNLTITSHQKEWFKNMPKLKLDVALDKIPARDVEMKQVFCFGT